MCTVTKKPNVISRMPIRCASWCTSVWISNAITANAPPTFTHEKKMTVDTDPSPDRY
jgi:hypothetical protein